MKNSSQRIMRALWDLEKPVVAAVQGVAAGLGAHLAFASDFVVASTEARFIEVFVRRGIAVDAAGAFLLPRLIGLQKAKELVFFGDDLAPTRPSAGRGEPRRCPRSARGHSARVGRAPGRARRSRSACRSGY